KEPLHISLDAWVPIIHAIEPRADRDPSKKDAKNMAWSSIYMELNNGNQFLRESGFKRFPGVAPRWAIAGGDIYGNSPGMEALGDIKQLQHEQLRKAQAIDYQTNPPLQVPTELKNKDVELLPGGITFVPSGGANSGIKTAFEVNLELNYLLQDIQDVRQRINSTFFSDLFLMLANSTDTRMTATEVAMRQEEKMLMLGPVLERLDNELLYPLIDSTFSYMVEAGAIPPAPDEMQGMELNVAMISMLAQAQRAIGVNGIDRLVGNLGMVAQMKPDVLDKFDADQWVDEYSDMLGVDPRLIVASDQVAIVRQKRTEAQAAAQQAAMAQQVSRTAKNLGQTPTGGNSNAAADLMNQFSGYSSVSPGQV
ncbi:MAG TPA: portal protein, partial [Edaphobacter sp.]|nr:portal protein [Edaphobacter sp.]